MNLGRNEKAFGIFALGIVLAWLAFWGTVVYVAWHFISKLW